MRRLYPWLLIGALILALSPTATARADTLPAVFLFLIDRMTVADLLLDEAAPLRARSASGGVGLANVRTGSSGSASGYLTLGSGGRAVAGTGAGLAFSTSETYLGQGVGQLFTALTGNEARGEVVHLAISELHRLAAGQNRGSIPGLVGSALADGGIPVAVFGNSDVAGDFRRFGVLVAMDRDGMVPAGEVGESSLVHDPTWPLGYRTDYQFLYERLTGRLTEGGLIVVELGDLARIEAVEALLSARQMEGFRRKAMQRIADLVDSVARFAEETGRSATVLVVAPSPSAPEASRGYLMAPILLFTVDANRGAETVGGLLTSPTTRRPGLVANVDVTATLLELFARPGQGAGRMLRVEEHEAPWDELERLYERIVQVHSQRLPLIQPYFFLQLAAVILSTALATGRLLLGWRIGPLLPCLSLVHLGLIAFPLALLLLPLLPAAETTLLAWVQAASVAAAGAFLAWMLRKRSEVLPFTVLCALTVAALTIDLLTGTRLLHASHLSYDPIGGSRYYGIGNEYMGLLLGAAGIAGGGLLELCPIERRSKALWIIAGAFGFVVLLLASPLHGANVGGTIAATVGLGVLLILFRRGTILLRDLLRLGVLVGLVVSVAAWFDLIHLGDSSSHLGSVVQQVADGGSDPLWNLFERKLEMNVRLIRLTVWSRAFFVSLLIALLFAFRRPHVRPGLLHRYPFVGRTVRGSLAGAFVALVANDSGIVAAATLMIPVISTLLYVVLHAASASGHGDQPQNNSSDQRRRFRAGGAELTH